MSKNEDLEKLRSLLDSKGPDEVKTLMWSFVNTIKETKSLSRYAKYSLNSFCKFTENYNTESGYTGMNILDSEHHDIDPEEDSANHQNPIELHEIDFSVDDFCDIRSVDSDFTTLLLESTNSLQAASQKGSSRS